MADETAARLVRAKGTQVQAEVTRVQVKGTRVQVEVTRVQVEVTYQAHYRRLSANSHDRARSELGGIHLNYRRVPAPPLLRRKIHPPATAPLWH